MAEGEERLGRAVTRPERWAGEVGAGPGALTGAGVVLEGAHAVPVRGECAHTLAGVCQPALDRPVGAARVHVLVRELGRAGRSVRELRRGGEVGADTDATARGGSDAPPSLSRSKRGGAKLREPEAPLRGRGSGALPPPARRTRLLPSPQGGAAGARGLTS